MAIKKYAFITILNNYLKEGMIDYGLSATVQRDYRYCSNHLRRFFRGYYLSYDSEDIPEGKHLNGHAVERYRRYRLTKVKPITVQKEIIVASNAVNYQIRERYRDMPNPFDQRHILRKHRATVRPRNVILPREKESELLIKCVQPLRDIVEFILETGLRRTEVLELTWDRIQDGLILFEPKHHKSGSFTACALSKKAEDIVNKQPAVNQYVFNHNGYPVSKYWLRYRWEDARDAAGLHGLRLHDLRRTAGYRWRREGKSLDAIQAQLRHKERATTEKVYAEGGAELAKSLFA